MEAKGRAGVTVPAEVFVNGDWAGLPDGTVVGPGRVIGDNAFSTVQGGVDAVDAGGTVHVAAGVYHERVFMVGPEKAGITVKGQLNAVLDGTGFGTTDRGFSIASDGVTVEGFVVRHYPQSYGIFITDCDGVALRNNEIIDNGLGPSGFRGGVYVREATNLLLEGNVIENNHNDGVILDWGVYGAIVRKNTFRQNRNIGLFVGGTGGTAPTAKATVEENLFEENGAGVATPENPTSFSIPGHAGMVVWDAGVRFRGNTLRQNDPDGLVWIHFDADRWAGSEPDPAFNSLEGNNFLDHPRHGIMLFTLVSTFIQPLGPVDPPASPHILRNNILANGGNGVMAVGSSNPLVEFNRIAGNGAGVVNTWAGGTIGGIVFPPVTVNAIHNWWGDASGPFHPTLNPAGQGNAVSDRVLFDPWLTQDPAEAVTPQVIHRLVHGELTIVRSSVLS